MTKISKLIFAALIMSPTPALAWPEEDFTENGIGKVSTCAGVYIIERNGTPYYIGRTRVSIRGRLWRHWQGKGSRMVATLLGGSDKLTVEFECLGNMEQMESQLIAYLGTTKFGNLRKETDPALWESGD